MVDLKVFKIKQMLLCFWKKLESLWYSLKPFQRQMHFLVDLLSKSSKHWVSEYYYCMVAEGCHSKKNNNKKISMCFRKILYIKKLLINWIY